MKKDSSKFKLAVICANILIVVAGALINPYFILIALCYMGAMFSVYYFGSKIKDMALNVGYVWLSKWALFSIFLIITGIYVPEIFLYALALFVIFNVSVNPAIFTLNKKASQ